MARQLITRERFTNKIPALYQRAYKKALQRFMNRIYRNFYHKTKNTNELREKLRILARCYRELRNV